MNWKKMFESTWNSTLSTVGPLILLTLVYAIVIAVSIGLLAPVTTAGYIRSLLDLQRKNRTPQVKDLFTEMRLFLPLTLFFLLAAVAAFIGFTLLIIPGFVVIAFLTFAAIYAIPLMVDKQKGLVEALQVSWEMAVREPVSDQIIIVVIYLLITSIGGSVPLGFLLTQPFATIFLLHAYEERLQKRASRPADTPSPPPSD